MTDLHGTVVPGTVNFYLIDQRKWGGPVHRLCDAPSESTTTADANLTYHRMGGQQWLVLPIAASDFAIGQNDKPQRPKLVVPDYRGALNAGLSAFGNIAGTPITRYKLLVTEIDPDIMWWRQRDRYLINRKSYTGGQLDLELARATDFRKVTIPSRTMMRDRFPGLGSALGS